MIISQDITVSLKADKEVYEKIYGWNNGDDLIKLTYTIHNNSDSPVKIKFEPYFDLEYTGDKVFGYNYCFRMYERIISRNGEIKDFKFDEYSAFVDIPPHDSVTGSGNFRISWLCRGAPPFGDWSFNIKYSRVITDEDNFYLAGSRYTDFNSKEFVKAWTGKLVSNSIYVKILQENR